MRYWTYYLLWTFGAYALRQPWLLAGVAVFLLLRKVIPDPGALLRGMRRMHSLRAQVEVNAANVTARRDLATLYLDLRRPKAALKLIEQALQRTPNDPEMLYLQGLALHRAGRHEEALAPLVQAVEADGRIRFGLPFRVAGDALIALQRWEGALDAYERYIASNSSDVSAYTRLAYVHMHMGDGAAAKKAIQDGAHTWRVLPGSMRQRSFGAFLGTYWARVWLLHEPVAIVFFVTLMLLGALFVRAAVPAVRGLSLPPISAQSFDDEP